MQINPDVELLHVKDIKDASQNLMCNLDKDDTTIMTTRNERMFMDVENAGCDISYRCIKCRSCKECKNHDNIHATSIKEEIEQEMINNSVTIDIKTRTTTAKLPLLHNPETKLAKNKDDY